MIPINYLAVLVSAVAAIILGSLWYGPFFGSSWRAMMGITAENMKMEGQKSATKSYIIMAIGALIMSYALAHTLIFGEAYLGIIGIPAGLQAGFWSWLGFIAPATIGTVIWEGKPWKLWFINAGYYMVSLLLMGIILSLWM